MFNLYVTVKSRASSSPRGMIPPLSNEGVELEPWFLGEPPPKGILEICGDDWYCD